MATISYVKEKQRKLLGTKIALLIAKFIEDNFPESMVEVFGYDNEYRAKLLARYEKKRVTIHMAKGIISIYSVRLTSNTSAMSSLSGVDSSKSWQIPLADPLSFEKTTQHVRDVLCST